MPPKFDLKPRMKNPVAIIPEAYQAMQALVKVAHGGPVPISTITLVELRASQINGCSFCVEMHSRELKKEGQPEEKIFGVAAWRENPWFDAAERAALALTESVTRIADRPDPVPDDVWADAAGHYDEKALATLLIAIATINVWNRLNAGVRQVAGEWGSGK